MLLREKVMNKVMSTKKHSISSRITALQFNELENSFQLLTNSSSSEVHQQIRMLEET